MRAPRRHPHVRALVLVAALLAATSSMAQENREGDAFLKLLDGKAYGESWDDASEYLRRSVTRLEWIAQMRQAREPLGTAAVRLVRDAQVQQDPPGAPPGEYLIITYETTFTTGMIAKTETLPLYRGADGGWRAVGYFVR